MRTLNMKKKRNNFLALLVATLVAPAIIGCGANATSIGVAGEWEDGFTFSDVGPYIARLEMPAHKTNEIARSREASDFIVAASLVGESITTLEINTALTSQEGGFYKDTFVTDMFMWMFGPLGAIYYSATRDLTGKRAYMNNPSFNINEVNSSVWKDRACQGSSNQITAKIVEMETRVHYDKADTTVADISVLFNIAKARFTKKRGAVFPLAECNSLSIQQAYTKVDDFEPFHRSIDFKIYRY